MSIFSNKNRVNIHHVYKNKEGKLVIPMAISKPVSGKAFEKIVSMEFVKNTCKRDFADKNTYKHPISVCSSQLIICVELNDKIDMNSVITFIPSTEFMNDYDEVIGYTKLGTPFTSVEFDEFRSNKVVI